ncbi:hypothetical protein A8144_04880 [Mycobacterium leprae 3125609]|nr:hypothetical protein A8144_04880 [Mycobacterium leprae 3125609]OAX71756.1 hypothetical protein A3216_03610 [Mycobacterium leprae 7935681]
MISIHVSTGCAENISSHASSEGSIQSGSAASTTTIDSKHLISDAYHQNTRFGTVKAYGFYLLSTEAGEEFTDEQVVIVAGPRLVVPPAIFASDFKVSHQR